MEIRQVTSDGRHVESACELYEEEFDMGKAMPGGWVRSKLVSSPDYVCYGAIDNGLQGFAFVFKSGYWLLDYLCVRKEARYRGIAGRLVQYVVDEARKSGARGVFIETKWEHVVRISAKAGFEVVTRDYRLPCFGSGGYRGMILMVKHIGGETADGMNRGLKRIWMDHYGRDPKEAGMNEDGSWNSHGGKK